MGADRRGPLAAFIIVAVIAAILLVTSVRSQAEPGWWSPQLPASVVAGPALEPHLWDSVGDGVDQAVHDGVVLVRKAASDASDPTTTTQALPASSVVAASDVDDPATTQTTRHPARHRQHRHGSRHHDGRSVAPATRTAPATPASSDPTPSSHDHGRHLGWYQHHDVAVGTDSGATGHGPGNGHGHGHAYGHSNHH